MSAPAALNAGFAQASGSLQRDELDNFMARTCAPELGEAATIFPEIDFFHGDWDIVEPDTSNHLEGKASP